ncbi:MAG: hypothetical protein KAR07_11575 [Spirochaetes bacterium]|nr:hypothetical protein [Spirochaetota bacterium]
MKSLFILLFFMSFSTSINCEEKLSLIGVWVGKPFMYRDTSKQMRIIFKKGGRLVFQNKFEFFNLGAHTPPPQKRVPNLGL